MKTIATCIALMIPVTLLAGCQTDPTPKFDVEGSANGD